MLRRNCPFAPLFVLSTHARARIQQRAIPEFIIDLLLDLADAVDAGGGCMKYSFDAESWAEARMVCGADAARLDRYRNAYLIISSDGTIVTAARAH